MRVGIVGIQHESNTFSSTPTTIPMFEAGRTYAGEAMRAQLSGTNHEVSGMFDVLDQSDIDAIPVYFALCLPSGEITRDTCEALTQTLVDSLGRAGALDGILAVPHGAGCGMGDEYRDFDGFWMSRVREFFGAEKPIIATIDPHCNLSQRMVDAADAIIAYRTNPHIDQLGIGRAAAELMQRTLASEVRPVMAASFPAVAINIEKQRTAHSPCAELYALADAMGDQPGILSNSVVLGFPYADTEEMGTSFITVTDGDAVRAQALSDALAAYLIDHRADFLGDFIEIPDAIAQAVTGARPVCLLDMGDNIGGGGPGDSTFIAHALHDRADTTAYVCFHDAAAQDKARAAGIGAVIDLEMGGKADGNHGAPLAAEVTVVSLHEGAFHEPAVRHGGQTDWDMGPTAIVRTSTGLTICLTTRRTPPVSLGPLTCCGLDPANFQILVAKGVQSPVPAYEPVCSRLIRVSTAGCTAADMRKFHYEHRRRPMYPFEETEDRGMTNVEIPNDE